MMSSLGFCSHFLCLWKSFQRLYLYELSNEVQPKKIDVKIVEKYRDKAGNETYYVSLLHVSLGQASGACPYCHLFCSVYAIAHLRASIPYHVWSKTATEWGIDLDRTQLGTESVICDRGVKAEYLLQSKTREEAI